MVQEKWYNIKGFPHYMISKSGQLYSKKRGIILKQRKRYYKNKYGEAVPAWIQVCISNDTTRITKAVHQLMAHQFMPTKPSVLHTIDHIDRNPFNNNLSNLRWATHSQQIRNSSINMRGIKLTMKDLNKAYLRTFNETLKNIALDYGLSKDKLCLLLNIMHPKY